ncbi:MAG: 23S rRNA (guanosine(2251)-2'-O)-methyltransferase RlmB [Alphaproteobacteria bacterium]
MNRKHPRRPDRSGGGERREARPFRSHDRASSNPDGGDGEPRGRFRPPRPARGEDRPERRGPDRFAQGPRRQDRPAPAGDAGNEPARGAAPGRDQERARQGGGPPWIYGTHAALAAIANPARRVRRILVGREQAEAIAPALAAAIAARGGDAPSAEHVAREDIERALPRGSVHQGLAVQASDVEPIDVDDLLRLIDGAPAACILALDQVTDPHNVGAILRSAAAFGVAAVILPERHAPAASAVMAKAASGAMERVPLVRVVNLARALDQLKAANVWCVGLAGDAPQAIGQADLTGRIALVLGSEGEGLRRLTRERCDMLVRIPMAREAVESLNVSNAAAVALYEIARRRG